MQDLNWNDLRFVREIARAGTLAAAAVELGVNQTTVARRLDRIEAALGISLFVRIGGKLVGSNEGMPVLEVAETVETSVAGLSEIGQPDDRHPAGVVRLTAVDVLLGDYLVPKLPSFAETYPHIRLEMIGDGSNLNLERQEADIALRLARPLTGESVIRKLADLPFAVYASPSLLGKGKNHDFNVLPWITYDSGLDHLPESQWIAEHVPDAQTRFRFNGGMAMRQAIRQGLGIGLLPCYFAKQTEDLVALSPPVVEREIWLMTNGRLRRTARVDAVVNWLIESFSNSNPVL